MVFFLIQDTSKFVATQLTDYLSARVPMKLLMLARIPVLIAFLALLIGAKHHDVPLALLAILEGTHTALYWIPLNIFFASNTEADKTGKQVGTFIALPQLFNLGAPLLSGFIAATLGFRLYCRHTWVQLGIYYRCSPVCSFRRTNDTHRPLSCISQR